jgi:hypothetical protein
MTDARNLWLHSFDRVFRHNMHTSIRVRQIILNRKRQHQNKKDTETHSSLLGWLWFLIFGQIEPPIHFVKSNEVLVNSYFIFEIFLFGSFNSISSILNYYRSHKGKMNSLHKIVFHILNILQQNKNTSSHRNNHTYHDSVDG